MKSETLRQQSTVIPASSSHDSHINLGGVPTDWGTPEAGLSIGRRVAVALVAASSVLYLNVGGQIYPVEVLLAGLVVIQLLNPRPTRLPRILLPALCLWLIGVLLSNFAADLPFTSYFRGTLRVVFTAANIWGIYALVGGRRGGVLAIYAGLALGSAAAALLIPSSHAMLEPWKFGFAGPATLAVILLACHSRLSRTAIVAVLTTFAGIHFALGTRSLAVIVVITALIIALSPVKPRKSTLPPAKIVVVGALGIFLIVGATQLYDELAMSGSLGTTALSKAEYQAGGAFGSLLSSRSEFLLSIGAITQSPLFGGGTDSVAPYAVAMGAATILARFGYDLYADRIAGDATAYHSQFLGVWAQDGALSVLFWLLVLALFLRGAVSVLNGTSAFAPLIAYLSVSGVWSFFFSPFGADVRFSLACAIVAIVICTPRREDFRSNDATSKHTNPQRNWAKP